MVLKNGQNIGYIRVSSAGQNVARQLAEIELDRVFSDKVSGSSSNRPALQEALNYVRMGDTLHVHSIDRLSRNLRDLQRVIGMLNVKGVSVQFHKENLTFNGNDDAMGTLMLQMMGAFAEFERTLIRERQAEGIIKAKQAGTRFGQPPKLNSEQVAEIKVLVAARHSKTELAKQYCVSRPTLYRALSD